MTRREYVVSVPVTVSISDTYFVSVEANLDDLPQAICDVAYAQGEAADLVELDAKIVDRWVADPLEDHSLTKDGWVHGRVRDEG